MNNVILIGRSTKDANVTYTQGSNPTCIVRVNLAVERRFKREGEPNADFISCVAFGRPAEFIEKHLSAKGSKMVIQGRIQTGSYEKDGQRVYTTEVVIEQVEFGEKKNANASTGAAEEDDGFASVPDDDEDLPFN